jgi:hypothetical protein
MPSGLKRFQEAESLHFIAFSCFHRHSLLDAPGASYRHYAAGIEGPVEIESQWTAFRRGNHLPQGVRMEQGGRSCFPARNVESRAAKPNAEAE